MAKEISWEIREQAEELYIVDGKTFDEVAEITGVSVAQLKRWGAGRGGRARGQRSEVGGQEGQRDGGQEGREIRDQRSDKRLGFRRGVSEKESIDLRLLILSVTQSS